MGLVTPDTLLPLRSKNIYPFCGPYGVIWTTCPSTSPSVDEYHWAFSFPRLCLPSPWGFYHPSLKQDTVFRTELDSTFLHVRLTRFEILTNASSFFSPVLRAFPLEFLPPPDSDRPTFHSLASRFFPLGVGTRLHRNHPCHFLCLPNLLTLSPLFSL